MSNKRFLVLRRHEGDRMYEEGEVREGSAAELKHLVPNVLEPLGDLAEKSEPAPLNKAEPAAPANKADHHKRKQR